MRGPEGHEIRVGDEVTIKGRVVELEPTSFVSGPRLRVSFANHRGYNMGLDDLASHTPRPLVPGDRVRHRETHIGYRIVTDELQRADLTVQIAAWNCQEGFVAFDPADLETIP